MNDLNALLLAKCEANVAYLAALLEAEAATQPCTCDCDDFHEWAQYMDSIRRDLRFAEDALDLVKRPETLPPWGAGQPSDGSEVEF